MSEIFTVLLALNGFVPAASSAPFVMPSPSSSAASHALLPSCASVTPYFIFQTIWFTLAMSARARPHAPMINIAPTSNTAMTRCREGRNGALIGKAKGALMGC